MAEQPDGPHADVPDYPGSDKLLELLAQLLAELDAAAPDSPDLDALWDRIDRNLP